MGQHLSDALKYQQVLVTIVSISSIIGYFDINLFRLYSHLLDEEGSDSIQPNSVDDC